MAYGRPWLLLLLLMASGCASAGNQSRAGGRASGSLVTVENDSSSPLRVFVRIGSNEVLLGRLDGMRTENFYLPPGASTGQINLTVRPAAARDFGEEHVSEPFSVQPGQWVKWQLRAPVGAYVPRISTIAVYGCEGEPNCR